jgi:hypothetical protein
MSEVIDIESRNKIIFDIQKKVIDMSKIYGNNGLIITLSSYKGCDLPEKVKVKIEEVL